MSTRFLSAALLFAAALHGQGRIEATTFTRDFGTPGEPGSMRIRFDRHGASVHWIELLDHASEATNRPVDGKVPVDPYKVAGEVELVRDGNPPVLGWRMLVLREERAGAAFGGVRIHEDLWDAEVLADGSVKFSILASQGLRLGKTFRKQPLRRDLEIDLTMESLADRPGPDGAEQRLLLTGLALSNPRADHVLGNPAVAIAVTVDADGTRVPTVVHVGGSPLPGGKADLVAPPSGTAIDFAGVTNRFFGAFLYAADADSRDAQRLVDFELWPEARPYGDVGLHSVPVLRHHLQWTVPKHGETRTIALRQYIGPKTPRVFDEHPQDYGRFEAIMDSDLTPACFCDLPGARPMARLLLWLLRGLHDIVGSWGFAIVLLTLLVRGALVPINFRMQKSMRAFGVKMGQLKPQLDAINAKYANDPKAKQQAMMEFQRQHKIFPPLGGCLPMFITIPVFLGLFSALRVAYELRHQPFLGWVTDLSRPDQLFELGWTWLPYFNVLPIVMVVLWLWLQAGTPLPTDPQQRSIMKMMRWMPLMIGVMLYNYASGLMVYMITSSLFGLVEQRVVKRILGPMPETGTAMPMAPQF